MKKNNKIKGLYWNYYKSRVMTKRFLGGLLLLVGLAFLMFVLAIPSGKKIRYEQANIISAGVYETNYSPKTRYKVETFGGDTYFVIEKSNRGLRDVDQIVCLKFHTLRIIGSQIANFALESRCTELSL